MLQSTLPYIAFQGVFGLPGANLLLTPIAFIARVYFHNKMSQNQSVFQIAQSLPSLLFSRGELSSVG